MSLLTKLKYLESPTTFKQFMSDNNVSLTHVGVFLALQFISAYYKEIIQIFLPFLLCLILSTYFITKLKVEKRENVNNFHIYLPNDSGQFSVIEKIKDLSESNQNTQLNAEMVTKLKEIFDYKFHSNSHDFKPCSNFAKPTKYRNASTETDIIVSCSNSVKPSAINITTTNSSTCVTAPTFVNDNLLISTESSVPDFIPFNNQNSDLVIDKPPPDSTPSNISKINLQADKNISDSTQTSNDVDLNIQSFSESNFHNDDLTETKLEFNSYNEIDSLIQYKLKSMIQSLSKENLSTTFYDSLKLLPKFSGNLKAFRDFRNRFHTIVDHLNHSDSDKALLLYLSLTENVIQSLGPITVKEKIDYEVLWDLLNKEYCRPQYGIMFHGAALNSLRNWDVCNDVDKLDKLYEFLLLHHRALEREGEVGKGLAVGTVIASKLDGELLSKVCEILGNPPENSILEDILFVIKEHINFLKICNLVSPESKVFENENWLSSKIVNNPLNSKSCLKKGLSTSSQNCLFCLKDTHTSHNCNLYNNPRDFHKAIFNNFACFNCLHMGHKSYACPKQKMCSLCQDCRKHSPVLCLNKYRL